MSAFDIAWAIVKMPYHMTDASNIESIMREGLKPLYYGLNAGMEEALDDIEEQFDYTREEALAYLKEYADHFGFDNVEDLWEGNTDWAFVANEYDPEELANYAGGREKPVLLEVGQEEDFMPDYGFYSGHYRTPKTVRPENIKIEMEFPSRKESGLNDEQYQQMIADMMREARS